MCFLPEMSPETLTKVESSMNYCLHGMNHAIAESFDYKNLLDQMIKKSVNHSKKVINWLKDNFPETEEMEPVTMEVCTYYFLEIIFYFENIKSES